MNRRNTNDHRNRSRYRRQLFLEQLEDRRLLAGVVTVELVEPPDLVFSNEPVDIHTRIKFEGDDEDGPWSVTDFRLYDQDLGLLDLDDVIASKTNEEAINIVKQGEWVNYTFSNVLFNQLLFEDIDEAVELYAWARVDDNDLIPVFNPVGASAVHQVFVATPNAGGAKYSGMALGSLWRSEEVSIRRADLNEPIDKDETTTWVLVHGFKSSPDMAFGRVGVDLVEWFKEKRSGDQVLEIDWSKPAGKSLDSAESFIEPVAQWTSSVLRKLGFASSTLNFIGHSFGSYVATETSKRLIGDVQSIVALDPAENVPFVPSLLTFGAVYNPNNSADFASDSSYSWAFYSSARELYPCVKYNCGNEETPTTADEAFVVNGSSHSGVVDLFSNMLKNPQGGVSRWFSLANLLEGKAGPWKQNQFVHDGGRDDDGSGGEIFEAVIETTLAGTAPLSIRYIRQGGEHEGQWGYIREPEITVLGNGIEIVDNDTTPRSADGTDFGSVDVASGSVTRQYTISNDGAVKLILHGSPDTVNIFGDHTSDFRVVQPRNPWVDPRPGTRTFSVTFDPSAPGLREATISIRSWDSDESPYRFSIAGTGTSPVSGDPVIDVPNVSRPEGNSGQQAFLFTATLSRAIAQAVTFDYATADGTATAGVDYSQTSGSLTFNPGETSKTISVLVTGDLEDEPDESFFVRLSNPVNATIGDGEGQGTIRNDETDKTAPTAELTEPQSGALIKQSTLNNRGFIDVTFSDLGGSGLNSATIVDAAPEFNLSGSAVNAGIRVSSSPQDLGEGTFRYRIVEGSFDIGVISLNFLADGWRDNTGNANAAFTQSFNVTSDGETKPEIVVMYGPWNTAQEITSGTTSPVSFGDITKGEPGKEIYFHVSNVGNATLRLDRIDIPSGFTLVDGVNLLLGASGIDSFTVRLETDTVGVKSGKVRIWNSDSDENPFEFEISGNVKSLSTSRPEIRVWLSSNTVTSSVEIYDGAVTPIDFGYVLENNNGQVRSFGVQNIGNADLTLGTLIAPDWLIVGDGLTSTITPGNTDWIVVQLKGTNAGARSGQLRFSTNDTDENPFNFPVSARVLADLPPAPTIGSLQVNPNPGIHSQDVSLVATDVTGIVDTVIFYRDENDDGTSQSSEILGWDKDGSDGWSLQQVATGDWPVGEVTLLAQAWDASGSQESNWVPAAISVEPAAYPLSEVPIPAGPEFLVNTTTEGGHSAATMAGNAAGDFVVVWINNDGDSLGIFAQLFDSNGKPRGNEFRVNTFTSSLQTNPLVAMTDDGSFVVTWQSYGQGDTDAGFWLSDVYAQRYLANGTADGPEFRVNTMTEGSQSPTAIATDAEGNFLIMWSGYGQWFNAAGTRFGNQFQLTDITADVRSIAMAGNGSFVATWQGPDHEGASGSETDIYAQRFNALGAAQGDLIRVNAVREGRQYDPSVAMDESGNFVITWTDYRPDPSFEDVFARQFSADGTPRGSEFRVNTTTWRGQIKSSVAMDFDGDFIIAWLGMSRVDNAFKVYVRKFADQGAALTDQIQVNSTTTGGNLGEVAMLADGNFVVTWQGSGEPDSAGIYARRYLDPFLVDTANDAVDANPGDGMAVDANGQTTLRAAIMEANQLEGENAILLSAGSYRLTIPGTGENGAATGDLDITGDLTIVGAGADQTFIDAANLDRVFQVLAGVRLDLIGVTITGGRLTGGLDGGGIANAGTLTITDSALSFNLSEKTGGAIFNQIGASLQIINSTLSNNSASSHGGAVANNGVVEISSSTFSGNLAGGDGGAIANSGTATIRNSTVAKNIAGRAGGIWTTGTVNVGNTIIADNWVPMNDADVTGDFTSQGYNLIGDIGSAAGFAAVGDITGGATHPVIDPLLTPLRNNGGTTTTHALLSGSPAVDAGNNIESPATDQRGLQRIVDGNQDGTGTIDIGAFEARFPGSITVNSTADAADMFPGDGLLETGIPGEVTLRAAIMEANSLVGETTIILPAGTYALDIVGTGEDAAATGDLDITNNLTIIGAGAEATVIDGGGLDRVFQIFADVDVDLSGLTIQGGSADIGGGIDIAGTLALREAIVSGNSATNAGGGLFGNFDSTISVENTTFSGNSAVNDGGAVESRGIITLSDNTLSNNTAGSDGGAIKLAPEANLTMSTTIISANIAGRHGGGMANEGVATIENGSFSANTALEAGAVANRASGLLTIVGSTFFDNIATADDAPLQGGGSIRNQGFMTISSSVVSGNSAREGGGILNLSGASAIIVDSSFSTNTVSDAGGAIHNTGNITITGSSLTGNSGGSSGALYNEGTLIVSTTEFTGNSTSSGEGGALRHRRGELTISDSFFTSNTAVFGGAVRIGGLFGTDPESDITVTVTNTSFTDNEAKGGGALFNRFGEVTISGSRFTENRGIGSGAGGIVNADASQLSVTDTVFIDNTAIQAGGAIKNFGSLSIVDSEFTGNSAYSGGAIYNYSGMVKAVEHTATVLLSDSTLRENSATRGGGLANYGYDGFNGSVTIHNSLLIQNTAVTAGGALFSNSGSITITASRLENNTASEAAGAIFSATELTLQGSIVTGNSSARHGGGLVTSGSTNISDTQVVDNRAEELGGGLINHGIIQFTNSEIRGNRAGSHGGGLANMPLGTSTIDQTIFIENDAALTGGGTFNALASQRDLFAATTVQSVGDAPFSLIPLHIDDNNSLDLAVANHRTNKITLLASDGSGGYSMATEISGGNSLWGMASIDYDHDGDDDLAVTNNLHGTVTLIRNDGQNTWTRGQVLNVGVGPLGIIATDLDADGYEDLAIAISGGTGLLSVFWGAENGTFPTAGQQIITGAGTFNLVAGDLDKDGDLDLAAVNFFAATISLIRNDGNRSLISNGSLPVADGPISLVAEDLNGDGNRDIAAVHAVTDTVSILLNQGDWSFGVPIEYAAAREPWTISAADFDDDGDIDLATPSFHTDSVSLLLNDGVAGFHDANMIPVGDGPLATLKMDVDGDNLPDLVTADRDSDSVTVLRNISNQIMPLQTGILNVLASTFQGNTAEDGAGLASSGELGITESEFSGNVASRDGGGILSLGESSSSVSRSLIVENTAGGDGGGIRVLGGLQISASTLSGNEAENGGGIYSSPGAELKLEGVTIADNHARGTGGGVHSASQATTIIHNTLVATNRATVSSPDIAGTFSSSSFNLIGDASGSQGLEHGDSGNQLGTSNSPIDPKILGLADNLGRTRTHALLPSSPAIDAGEIAEMTIIDQRRIPRPQDGNSDGSHLPDIGAFELGTFMPTLDLLPSPTEVPEDSSQQIVSLFGIGAGGDDDQPLLVEVQSDNSDLITNLTVTYASPNATGTISYLPGKDRNGLAVITVTVRDAGLDGIVSNADDLRFSRIFTVSVTPVNDPPVTNPVIYRPTENTPFELGKASGLVTVSNDVDGDVLSFSIVTPPSHGQLALNTDGSFRYTPDTHFNRTDSFTYKANDGVVDSNVETVTVDVLTSYPWYNGSESMDVTDDGDIHPRDVLHVIDKLNSDGPGSLSQQRGSGLVAPFYDVNRDGSISSADAMVTINHLNAAWQPTVQIRVVATDASGNRIATVTEGETFWLTSYLADLRPAGKGVFAAYFDLHYQDSLVAIAGSPVFVSPYVNATHLDSSNAGLLDEIGSIAGIEELLTSEYPQFRLPMKAKAVGEVSFVSSAANESPQHDVLVYASSDPVTDRQINYGTSLLNILPLESNNQSGAEGEAGVRMALLDFVFKTDLPTTAAAHLELSDWSVPYLRNSSNYQQAVDDIMRTQAYDQPKPDRPGRDEVERQEQERNPIDEWLDERLPGLF